jgi:osmotically-inducible protein OsmY
MNRRNTEKISFNNDDHSRYAGPEFLNRISAQGKGPKGYLRPDARIYEDVNEALLNDARVDASDIEVEVHEGIVTLRGAVEDRQMKKEAQACIEHIPGIEDVFNLITLHEFREQGAQGLVKNQARIDP